MPWLPWRLVEAQQPVMPGMLLGGILWRWKNLWRSPRARGRRGKRCAEDGAAPPVCAAWAGRGGVPGDGMSPASRSIRGPRRPLRGLFPALSSWRSTALGCSWPPLALQPVLLAPEAFPRAGQTRSHRRGICFFFSHKRGGLVVWFSLAVLEDD